MQVLCCYMKLLLFLYIMDITVMLYLFSGSQFLQFAEDVRDGHFKKT